jgi:hypothetical protein
MAIFRLLCRSQYQAGICRSVLRFKSPDSLKVAGVSYYLGKAFQLVELGSFLDGRGAHSNYKRTPIVAEDQLFFHLAALLRLDENYCFQPRLFRGMSGIAYSALRSVAPEKYPSLIAFDLVP